MAFVITRLRKFYTDAETPTSLNEVNGQAKMCTLRLDKQRREDTWQSYVSTSWITQP